jgi:pimeloyl-ACP methyl ester carboxylesterase
MNKKKTGYVDLEDGKVYVEAAGEGLPLVFLHAGFVDSRMWDDQVSDLSENFTTVRYDMLGFGRSDVLESPISRRQELYRVLEHSHVGRAILVGCSAGGETVIDAALDRPDLVAGMILCSAVPAGFEMQGEPPEELMEMLAAFQQGDHPRASEMQTRLSIDGPFRKPEQVDPLVRQREAEMNRYALAKGSWGLTLAPRVDLLEPPADQRLGQIHIPTLIIAGELDNPEILRAADVMAREIPEAKKVIIPGSAHYPNLEKPAEFNQAVKDFLRSVQA